MHRRLHRLSATLVSVTLVGCFILLSPPAGWAEEVGFVPIFDGETLDGWVQHGGEAIYHVEDGVIVGTAVPNTPNSFLCTEKDYSDFILELELKVDDHLNSGIQIRSHVFDEPTTTSFPGPDGEMKTTRIPAGRVHGYQVEVDPTDRAYSGGIYDEGRRGWLYDLGGDDKQEARDSFKREEWNHYRIEAIGDRIRTWINDVPVADLTDEMDPSGFIGLQVHSVRDDMAGKEIRFRNIKIKEVKSE